MKFAGNSFREVEIAGADCAGGSPASVFVPNAEAFPPTFISAVFCGKGPGLARSFVFTFRDIHANQFR